MKKARPEFEKSPLAWSMHFTSILLGLSTFRALLHELKTDLLLFRSLNSVNQVVLRIRNVDHIQLNLHTAS
ncbi:MAG TPA: hypothetical protein DCX54_00095 [Flavobacteriales bacterium]|nr:hypothetical protein [Flavobacteriales bacterium]